MLQYLVRRLGEMVLTLVLISIIAFAVIQLPPGTFLDHYVAARAGGETVEQAELEALTKRFALDRPIHERYLRWVSGMILRGDFGQSFEHERPVVDLIKERLPLTVAVAFPTTLFVYLIAIPIGIHSALHQYSTSDYVFSLLGFVGLAVPNFLFAIILIYLSDKYFGGNVGGLFSTKYELAPWSWGKFVDMLKNLWIPILVVGTGGTAGTIRVMRGMLLDELSQPYVVTARAKGLPEMRLVYKYPVRIALSPVLSTIGYVLPNMISGTTIVSIVLNLPTTGPLLLGALLAQDMFLAGSFIMLLSTLTVIGTFLSDLLLAWADPRIRLG